MTVNTMLGIHQVLNNIVHNIHLAINTFNLNFRTIQRANLLTFKVYVYPHANYFQQVCKKFVTLENFAPCNYMRNSFSIFD